MTKAISVRLDDDAQQALRMPRPIVPRCRRGFVDGVDACSGVRSTGSRCKGVGREQQGERYGVVVQSHALLPRSVMVVAPMSRSARPASLRPEVEVAGNATRVLVEQLGAVDVQRLGPRIARLSAAEMWAADDALLTVLGHD